MKKKGFTLIELLAVIVILAVIALITTPLILNVIDTARKGAAESGALGYLDAVEKQIIINQVEGSATQIVDGTYDLPMEGITIKGEAPSEGWIVIEAGRVTNYSMKIMNYIVTKDEETTAEGEVLEKPSNTPEVSYICKRAVELHEEECTNSDDIFYCKDSGYTSAGSKKTTTITYGNLGTMGEELKSGDALDCDVDGTGYNHRFYYVTNLESDPEYAVLIYYNNTTNGVADNTSAGLMAYDFSSQNWHGPTSGITNLPTVNDWNKLSLTNDSKREIMNENGEASTEGGDLPTEFRYEKEVNGEKLPLAARLLTYQEVISACGEGTVTSTGYLDNCNYLMENTLYSSNSLGTSGYWLETPSLTSSDGWFVFVFTRSLWEDSVSNSIDVGVRPVIEVPISKILH